MNNESVKGRTGTQNPYTLKGKSCEGKNRNPRPCMNNESVKGRTETQNPCTLKKKKKKKKEKETHGLNNK